MSTVKSSTEHLTINADGSGKDLKLQTNGTERVIVKSDGDVGIGTSSPAQALQVNTSSGNAYMRVERASQSTGQVGLQIGGGTSSTDWFTYMPASSDDLAFFGNSQERMRIDSSGRVTMPYQPAFRVKNSTQTINATGTYEVAFSDDTGTNKFDIGNNFNTSTYRFIAPVSGTYWFSANLRVDGMSGYFRIYISKNGQTAAGDNLHSISGNNVSTNYESLTVSGAIKLSANDYVSVFVTSDVDTSWTAHKESNFSGFLIG